MQIVHTQKWLFTMLLIYPVTIICSREMPRNSIQNNDYECRRSFNNILSDLRNNWQSPISYLQTRGYIPPSRDQSFNIKFRGRDEKLKGDVVKTNNNQKAASNFNREERNGDVSSNSANNNLDTNADNHSAGNNMNTNVDTRRNTNLNSKLNSNLNYNNLNSNLNGKLNTNFNTHLNPHLNTDLSNNLRLKSELNTNHKMESFPTASAIARLNADTMSNISPISNLNNSPNLINELNTNNNLNSYADLANDLNQPPPVQSKIDGKNVNFLHSVKNKFLGFFLGKPDSKSANRKSAFSYDIYNDFADSLPKELTLPENKLQDISKLYGKASDPEIERIIERGLKKDNEYDKEFISSTANKDLLSRLGKYT